MTNYLFEPLQSGFRKCHSTKMALAVTNDLLMASDSGATSILILLDQSSAFDTADHSLLLTHIERVFGVLGTVFKCFRSYFTDNSQFISMGGHRSEISSVFTGVPQGPVLGWFLFLYLSVTTWLSLNGLHYNFYDEYTQIYIHSKPDKRPDSDFLSDCITEIKTVIFSCV